MLIYIPFFFCQRCMTVWSILLWGVKIYSKIVRQQTWRIWESDLMDLAPSSSPGPYSQTFKLLQGRHVRGCHTFTAKGLGSIPGRGTKIPHVMQCRPAPKRKWLPCDHWGLAQFSEWSVSLYNKFHYFYFYPLCDSTD